MGEFSELYKLAQYYDVLFERDVTPEVDFVLAAYRHYVGRPPLSALELGSGPGYHARELARRGLRVAALDLRREMLALGQEKARLEGLELEWLEADMRSFRLPFPVDLAISMFDSHDALLTNEDLLQHLNAVAENLTPSGLLILCSSPPQEVNLLRYPLYHYQAERDGIQVELLYGVGNPQFDLVTEVVQVGVELRVIDHGQERVFRDTSWERLLSPQQFVLLANLSQRMRVVGWHGAYDLKQPLDLTPGTTEMITILQKV